ncbi:MAG: hypothetical protein JXA46_03495 [Dehalococcoidales bacterium]|nr:hypothetical protein [Dehalococcoidales bacterium]
MAVSKTAKYIREASAEKSFSPVAVPSDIPEIVSDESFGNMGFHIYTQMIIKAYTMEAKPHKHDFSQYLIFFGGDASDLINLGGVVEMSLGEDVEAMEKHVITKSTAIYIPAGLYHCPLIFKEVTRPIALTDLYFSDNYQRK